MPTISMFYGIMIRMYVNDHNPPHFHAFYGDREASIAIETGDIVEGRLPHSARRLVKDWAVLHRDELLENWQRRDRGEPLERIAGLDAE